MSARNVQQDVQAALAYIASLQPGSDESYEGEEREVMLAMPGGLSKGESLHKERMRILQLSLTQSKQRVVQHLLQSRKIQESITQSEIVENAVKAHIETKAHELKIAMMRGKKRSVAGFGSITHPNSSSSAKHVLYDNVALQLIEHAGQQLSEGAPRRTTASSSSGIAAAVQRALHNYDDAALCQELDSFSFDDNDNDNGNGNNNENTSTSSSRKRIVDQEMFVRVALAASNARMTEYEARGLYHLARSTLVENQKRQASRAGAGASAGTGAAEDKTDTDSDITLKMSRRYCSI